MKFKYDGLGRHSVIHIVSQAMLPLRQSCTILGPEITQ
jgi:hypothetical protein